MASQSGGDEFSVPTSAEAVRMLREITPVARRSRQLTRNAALGRPLLAWGLAWMAGATLFQWIPGVGGMAAGSVPCAGALVVCWLGRSPDVRLPGRRRFALLWFALLASSPLLVAVATPHNARLTAVFLASVWAVGMVLYGIATEDVPLAVLGLAVVVLAGATRIAVGGEAMIAVGIGGGLGMAALGYWRTRWPRG